MEYSDTDANMPSWRRRPYSDRSSQMDWKSKRPNDPLSPSRPNSRFMTANRYQRSSIASSTTDSDYESLPQARIYVGNLLYTVQESDVTKFLNQNSIKFVNIDISIDPMTGRNPTYCFANLESPEDACRAIETLNGKMIMGREVKIKPATTRSMDRCPTLRVKKTNCGWSNREYRSEEPYSPTFDRWSRSTCEAEAHFEAPVVEGKRLWVGKLPRLEPQSAVDATIQSVFTGFEITAVSKIISPQTPKDMSTSQDLYYLFVDMADSDDVKPAIEALNGKMMPWGGRISVQHARDNQQRKFYRDQVSRNEARNSRAEWL